MGELGIDSYQLDPLELIGIDSNLTCWLCLSPELRSVACWLCVRVWRDGVLCGIGSFSGQRTSQRVSSGSIPISSIRSI